MAIFITDDNDTLDPPFGLAGVVPATATASWGARLIVTQDGMVDFVTDRQGCAGELEARAKLLDELGKRVPMASLLGRVSELLATGELETRTARTITLNDWPGVTVYVDTQASAGYAYLAAHLTQA